MVEGVAAESRTSMRQYSVVIELTVEGSTYVLTCNQTCTHLQTHESLEPLKTLRLECQSLDDLFELTASAATGLVDDAEKSGIDTLLFEDAMRDLEENIVDELNEQDLAYFGDDAVHGEVTGTEQECLEALRKSTTSGS